MAFLGGDAPSALYRVEVNAEVDSPRRVRRWLRECLASWELDRPEVVDPVVLVADELVTNAITHGGAPITLELWRAEHRVRLEVGDGGGGTVGSSSADPSYRGLRLVDTLTAAWGVDSRPGGGKVVWAELAAEDVTVG